MQPAWLAWWLALMPSGAGARLLQFEALARIGWCFAGADFARRGQGQTPLAPVGMNAAESFGAFDAVIRKIHRS